MSKNKMTLVSLESPYSLYFSHMSEVLEKIASDNNVALEKKYISVNDAYSLYLPGFTRLSFWNVHEQFIPDEQLIKRVSEIRHLNNNKILNPDRYDLEVFAQYALFIESVIDKNPSCLFILYNDLRWNHAIAIDVLRRKNVPYFVFERGVFRPYTTTIDCWGVNANSNLITGAVSLTRTWDNHRLGTVRPKQKNINLKFAQFFLLQTLSSVFVKKGGRALRGKRRNLKYYFQLYLKQYFSRKVDNTNALNAIVDDKYIFVPLQLSDDTQTLINSDYNNTQEFIDEVERVFLNNKVFASYRLVFKIHPMDCNQYKFSPESIVSNMDTKVLIEKSALIVTINSTVGFESFCQGKKVVTFGGSFYTREPMVYPCQKGDGREIIDFMQGKDISAVTIAENIDLILKNYQAPGSVFAYDNQDLHEVANFIYDTWHEIQMKSEVSAH